MNIKHNLEALFEKLGDMAILVGVTKYSSRGDIIKAVEAGLNHIGENRVESVDKIKDINAKKHFIGNIQSNKIKKIVENFDMIQSVSTLKHLVRINDVARELKKKQEVLLQLRMSNDKNKSGFKVSEIDDALDRSKELTNIIIKGFMMMASNTNDKSIVKEEFRRSKELFDRYRSKFGLEYLSMGMSNDYDLAIQEGSNMVRIGSRIFR